MPQVQIYIRKTSGSNLRHGTVLNEHLDKAKEYWVVHKAPDYENPPQATCGEEVRWHLLGSGKECATLTFPGVTPLEDSTGAPASTFSLDAGTNKVLRVRRDAQKKPYTYEVLITPGPVAAIGCSPPVIIIV